MKKTLNNQDGFTILELLIATLVFSTILVVATFAIIQISRTYIRGYIGSETQNTNRNIADQITQAIQLSTTGEVTLPPNSPNASNVYWFCVNETRYTYVYDQELTASSTPVFLQDKDSTGNCSGPGDLTNAATGTNRKELLSTHMMLLPPTGGGGILTVASGALKLYNVNLTILYGDNGSYITRAGLPVGCAPIVSGGDFCAKSSTSTSVEQRT